MLIALLAAFFAYDSVEFAREPLAAIRRDRAHVEPLRIHGGINALWLGGVVLAVALIRAPWREVIIVMCAGASLRLTPGRVRRDNGFSAGPMVEVAVVFAGIFLTMIPALDLLRLRGDELGVHAPWHFFWASGILSSFLDNAPTYLTFLALGQGIRLPAEVVGVPESILVAISVGSVAMGANTYIGNAPNFMVKAIAEEAGVRMPGFLGYMLYSGAILIPLFVVVTFIFFR
jgi:Na+/H+ antiporter NhaD/arsenite permease-like protein